MMDNLNPSWLDDRFLVQVLQSIKDIGHEVEVIKYQCQRAVPPGANYLSQLFRVRVHYKTNNEKVISLIIKTPVEGGIVLDMMEKSSGYKKEIKVYNEILPKMYALHNKRFTATPFFCPLDSSLVLEDLQESGYKMADRLKQLDYSHCQHFLESLARLHAMSVAVQETHPGFLEDFKQEWLFNDKAPEEIQHQMKVGSQTMMKKLAAIIEKLNGCDRYADMIRRTIYSYWENMVEVMKPKDELQVLNHGDTWTNNILFKYDSCGDVVDAKLIDFQVMSFGSFTFDIILFWWTSANEEVREHHRAELFEVYRQTLNQTLHELRRDSKMVSKEDFDKEMKAKAPYSIHVVQSMLGVAMADPQHLQDLTKFDSLDSFMYSFTTNMKSKYYKAVLPNILRQIEEFGGFK